MLKASTLYTGLYNLLSYSQNTKEVTRYSEIYESHCLDVYRIQATLSFFLPPLIKKVHSKSFVGFSTSLFIRSWTKIFASITDYMCVLHHQRTCLGDTMVKGQVLESGRARFKYDILHSVIWGIFYNDVPNMSKVGLVSSSSKSRTTESECRMGSC